MDTSNITIETKNLLLKGITLEYKDDIFREFTAEITTLMFPKPAEKIEETIEFIKNSIIKNKSGSNFQVVILNKKNQEFLGCAEIHKINTKTPGFSIWLKKSAHGFGFGKETIIALKEWADKNLDYEYLIYSVDKENHLSKKIPESLEGTIAREYDKINMSGNKLHLVEYRIYPPKK